MTCKGSARKIAVGNTDEKIKNYLAALRGVGLDPVGTIALVDPADFGGLVLPGGGDIDPALYGAENEGSRDIDRALDEAQLALADAFLRAGKPVLGICKGQQILNVYFGGGLVQHLATAPLHRQERDAVHACESLPGAVLERLYGRRYPVNSMHHQGVGRLGEGLRAAAFAPDGAVEAIEHDSLPVLGVQWHPERMCFAKARPDTVDGAEIFRYFRSLVET